MERETITPLQPYDAYNRRLEQNVRPPGWINPTSRAGYHLVVIGAGTAGLVTAAAAAGLGARVALVERQLMGGDCLNVGCVPSKAIIASARAIASARTTLSFHLGAPFVFEVDFASVMKRMRNHRAEISLNDSASRFAEKGVDVYLGSARFLDSSTVEIQSSSGNARRLKFRKAVIATGARASAPPIPGLDSVPYLTNESLFSLTERPERFGIIGAGPIGCEMAQAFASLGSKVVLFEMADRILVNEDIDASAIVQRAFDRDGITTIRGSRDQKIIRTDDGSIQIVGNSGEGSYDVRVDQLLVAVGRAPNVESLGLEQVGVDFDHSGVKVNDRMQTTNRRIFAAGDICSKFKFTHAADFQARIVVQNALFAVGPIGRKRVSDLIVPWATYTSPEVAHVGMYEKDATGQGIAIDSYVQHFSDVDRAILDGKTEGFVRVHVRRGSDKIVGATIVAENAGDLISEITLAMKNRIGLSAIGAVIHPYPTHADAIRRLGDQYNRTRLTPRNQKLLGWILRCNVGR